MIGVARTSPIGPQSHVQNSADTSSAIDETPVRCPMSSGSIGVAGDDVHAHEQAHDQDGPRPAGEDRERQRRRHQHRGDRAEVRDEPGDAATAPQSAAYGMPRK